MATHGTARPLPYGLDGSTRIPFALLLVYLTLDFLRPHDVFVDLRRWRPMLVVGILTILATVWVRRRRLLENTKPLLPLAALLGVVAASTAFSVDRVVSVAALVEIGKQVALAWLLLVLVRDERRFTAVLGVITISLGALAIGAIVQGIDAGLMREFRIEGVVQGPRGNNDGPFRDNNDLARVLAASVPLWCVLVGRGERMGGELAMLGLLIVIVGVAFTFSRGGFLALVVGIAVFACSFRPRWHGIAFFVAFVSAVLLLSPRSYLQRVGTIGAPGSDASVQGRIEIWRGAAQAALARPLLGNGPGTFERREPESGARPRSSHNIFVEVLAELGFLGLAAYTGMLVAVLYRIHAARRDVAPRLRIASFGVEAAILGYLTASLALSAPYQSFLFAFMGLSLALGNIADKARVPAPAG